MSADPVSRSGVIAGGNWIVDHTKIIDSWPPEDSLVSILGESHGNGGAPYNVLKNLSKLGVKFPLEAVGLIGDDPDGDYIVRDCDVHGIERSQLRRVPGAATSYTDVMTVGSTGRRTFFHRRGVNSLLMPEDFNFSRTRAKIFHLGYVLLLEGLDELQGGKPRARDVLKRASEAGLCTSVDVVSENSDRFRTVVLPALTEVDILFVNDFEAEKLTNILLRKDGAIHASSVEAAARALVSLGVRQWVVLHFPEAAYALNANGASHWQASLQVPPQEIKGLAGAGDAFASGVLYGQHLGWPMAASLKLAVCVAASSLSDPSCSNGVLSAEASTRLSERWNFRTLPE
jgi:sugar/nucleoside kinase (ribokinase family)